MTDNFELIKEYLRSNDIPEHNSASLLKNYVIEIISRGKDNPDMPAANRHFKNYYITCIDSLEKYEDEIKALCDNLRMRAYVSVNYKMFDQILMNVSAEAAKRVASHNFGKPYAIYEHCSGEYVNRNDRKFIIDVDEGQLDYTYYVGVLKEKMGIDPILIVPTRSGYHIITNVFSEEAFTNYIYHDGFGISMVPDIKRNHLTLLYENL